MNEALLEEVYDLMYSPIVTPYNLLDNAKLDNYDYVNYYKEEDSLVAEMRCTMPYGSKVIFYYYFDNEDFLVAIHKDEGGEIITVFNRKEKLNSLD